MKSRVYITILFCLWFMTSEGQSFSPGNVVVVRMGDGSGPLSLTATPLFLDEYTATGGAPVQSISMPTAINGLNKRLTLVPNNRTTGLLCLSQNEQYLTLTGLDAAPSTSSSASVAATVQRVIGIVDYNGLVNTSTGLTGFSGAASVPTSAVTANGADIWASVGNRGLWYCTLGSSAGIQLFSSSYRTVEIYDGNLFGARENGEINKIGNNLPTSGPVIQTNLFLVGSTGNGIFMADLNPSIPGNDVLYLAGELGTLQKFSFNGSNWINSGKIGTASDVYFDITGVVSGATVTLYITRQTNFTGLPGQQSELVRLVDNTGQAGSISGMVPTLLATSPPNTIFRGVSLAPIKCKQPTIRLGATSPTSVEVFITDSLIAGGPYEYAVSASATPPTSGHSVNLNVVNVDTLNPGVHYYIHVRRTCGSGESSKWTTTDFTTAWPPCSSPVNFSQTLSGPNTILSWDQIFTAVKYEYNLSTDPIPTSSGEFVTIPTINLPDLTSAKKYFLHVRAYCGGGDTSAWSTKFFTTACFTPEPHLITNNWQVGTAEIGWKGESRDQVFEYTLLSRQVPVGGSLRLVYDTILAVKDLVPGNKYHLSIRQRCSSGAVSDWGKLEFNVSGVQVFPNPTRDRITIRVIGQDTNGKQIFIYDASGKRIISSPLSGNAVSINVAKLANGLYFVRFGNEHTYYTTFFKK